MIENIRLSFQGIWSHKLRSFLTMLGVIIGIAAIIAIVSTIAGTNEQIKQNLIGAGNNNVKVTLMQGGGEYWMDGGAPAGVYEISRGAAGRDPGAAPCGKCLIFQVPELCRRSGQRHQQLQQRVSVRCG